MSKIRPQQRPAHIRTGKIIRKQRFRPHIAFIRSLSLRKARLHLASRPLSANHRSLHCLRLANLSLHSGNRPSPRPRSDSQLLVRLLNPHLHSANRRSGKLRNRHPRLVKLLSQDLHSDRLPSLHPLSDNPPSGSRRSDRAVNLPQYSGSPLSDKRQSLLQHLDSRRLDKRHNPHRPLARQVRQRLHSDKHQHLGRLHKRQPSCSLHNPRRRLANPLSLHHRLVNPLRPRLHSAFLVLAIRPVVQALSDLPLEADRSAAASVRSRMPRGSRMRLGSPPLRE